MKIELMKGVDPRLPRFVAAGPVIRHIDSHGYNVTTGIGPT